MHELTIPIADEDIRSLVVGDPVALSGIMLTGRDTVHKWMIDTFIKKTAHPRATTWPFMKPSSRCCRAA